MRAFFLRKGGRHEHRPTRIEEVLCPTVLADPNIDADELSHLLRNPHLLQVDEPEPELDEQPVELPPEPSAVRMAKLAGLVLAVMLLCGAVVAAAFLDRQRRQGSPAPAVASSITGLRALAVIAAEPGEVTAALQPAARRPPSSSHRATSGPGSRTPGGAEAVARKFYGLLAKDPRRALALLGGELTDAERQELAVAWHQIDRVQVRDLQVRPDGLVQTVTVMTGEHGEQYRMLQLLRVAGGKITEVRLLSAQQTRAR